MMISTKQIFSLVVLVSSTLEASLATRLNNKGSRRGGGDADAGRALKSSKKGAEDYDSLADLLVSGSCFYCTWMSMLPELVSVACVPAWEVGPW
jgi:hypothetical protein